MANSHFQTLQLDRQQIRLLHLHPGGFHDPILATLSVAYLDDRPKYEALSYVWGDPNVCFDIIVDGHTLSVTINLWAALRRLRRLDVERVLWIDAICINQADGIEKTHQVGMMSEIYRTTWRCLAWLGEFEQDTALKPGMSLQAYRGSGVTMEKSHAQMAFQFIEKLSRFTTDGHFTVETEMVQPGWMTVMQSEMDAIHALVNLKWFTRIWTVQELILLPRVRFMLGTIACEEALASLSTKTEWDLRKHYVQHAECCKAVITEIPSFQGILAHFWDNFPCVRRLHRFNDPSDLDYALQRFRHRHCADPRDKVFALLGFAHPKASQLVNYTLDKKRVYTDVVRYNIKSDNSLHPLTRLSERDRDTSLPSWVLDFEAAVLDEPRSSVFIAELSYVGCCARMFSAGTQRAMELGASKEDLLQLGGRKVDKIRSIFKSPPLIQWQDDFGPLRASWRALLEIDPFLDMSSYPSGGTYTEAFWRTCTCDIHDVEGLMFRFKEITVDEERVKNELDQGKPGVGTSPVTTFFVSHQGYIGVGPENIRVGDVVCVLFGGYVPFILREISEAQEKRGSHTFIGHSYVHGIMDGEALDMDIPDEQVMIV